MRQKILSKTQVEIIWAQNGEICVDFFKKNPDTNLILMDMQMPIKDGFEAAKDILKIDQVPEKMNIMGGGGYISSAVAYGYKHCEYCNRNYNLSRILEINGKNN